MRSTLPSLVGLLAFALAAPIAAASTGEAGAITTRPADIVDAAGIVPELRVEARYAGDDNFVGRPVEGYEAPLCLLTRAAAEALAGVQRELLAFDHSLLVYDCYRPQRAVDDFVRWAADPDDVATKPAYYPDVPKDELFERGYIARRSGHSRASTVDLTIVDLATGEPIDTGTPWDFFSVLSHTECAALPATARRHRLLLRAVMERNGFTNYDKEWWHFTLADEPHPDRHFDFPVR